ncbi:hypothetical protein KBA84_02260 [Patescibacteria group bacterium]|nr:hypothetical protein [Patescibacteria group bacterium]
MIASLNMDCIAFLSAAVAFVASTVSAKSSWSFLSSFNPLSHCTFFSSRNTIGTASCFDTLPRDLSAISHNFLPTICLVFSSCWSFFVIGLPTISIGFTQRGLASNCFTALNSSFACGFILLTTFGSI